MEAIFAELAADLAPVYRRRDLRANALLYLRGLLMPLVAGNCWSIAEAVGLDRPYRLHHLLGRASWDEDAARDAVRAFLARYLGADGGVLIFDETGQAKKGTMTAAAGRQYSGTMGRVENVIVAVCTRYATDRGHALIDRDLYVQDDWFKDPARMAKAGFPADHAFATKPALALAQAKRALAAGIRPGWAAGDEVYGRSRELREFLEAAGIGYVFAVPVEHRFTTCGGLRMRADQVLGLVEPVAWNRRSCGMGAKGPRYYDWAWIATDHPRRQLLIRRSIADPGEIAYFYAYVPDDCVCSLTDLVKIAGARWKVEDDFQDSKSTVALDQTQVRCYRAWKRHVTLAMAALALGRGQATGLQVRLIGLGPAHPGAQRLAVHPQLSSNIGDRAPRVGGPDQRHGIGTELRGKNGQPTHRGPSLWITKIQYQGCPRSRGNPSSMLAVSAGRGQPATETPRRDRAPGGAGCGRRRRAGRSRPRAR
jgi:SRSO17 transposase